MTFYQVVLLGVLLAQLCAQSARAWIAWQAYKIKQINTERSIHITCSEPRVDDFAKKTLYDILRSEK